MTPIHPSIGEISKSVTVRSITNYIVLGEVRLAEEVNANAVGIASWKMDPSLTRLAGTLDGPVAELLSALEKDLYVRLYTRPSLTPSENMRGFTQRDHIAKLSNANTGKGSWDPGWTFEKLATNGRVAISKGGLMFYSAPSDILPNAPPLGSRCRVRVPKEFRHLTPGFYSLIGDADLPDMRVAVIRTYWHITKSVSEPFIGAVSRILNAERVPFRAKVLSDPLMYKRADAGVLMFFGVTRDQLRDILAGIYNLVASGLRPSVPMFSLRIAPGLGLAEDPLNGLSFGQFCCRTAAIGLLKAFTNGANTPAGRLDSLIAAFRTAGIDPHAPHLAPGSIEDYTFKF